PAALGIRDRVEAVESGESVDAVDSVESGESVESVESAESAESLESGNDMMAGGSGVERDRTGVGDHTPFRSRR
ncbi:hypothetical protein, partial [Burkholderia dolosa]|uniref:hypothetical protein n=1 Tax=Burkholderia dolosa TaxID=152500 RepID=UPI001C934B50